MTCCDTVSQYSHPLSHYSDKWQFWCWSEKISQSIRFCLTTVVRGGSKVVGGRLRTKTCESNFIHQDYVQFGKQHSWYKAILPLSVLSQQCCEVSYKLDTSRNLSTFPSQLIAVKSKLKFCHSVPSPSGSLVGLAPPKQNPPKWNMKQYKTVMFIQISECQAHCTNVKPPYRRLSSDGFVGTPSFSLAISLVTMIRF